MGESESRWGVDEVHIREVTLGGRSIDAQACLTSSDYFVCFQQGFGSADMFHMEPIYLGEYGDQAKSRSLLLE